MGKKHTIIEVAGGKLIGGIRTPPGVAEQPEVRLRDWRVYEVEGAWGKSKHFVGWSIADNERRVSSQIVAFDQATRLGTTRSGRVYKLSGDPGNVSDSNYAWQLWKRAHLILTAVDVTEQY